MTGPIVAKTSCFAPLKEQLLFVFPKPSTLNGSFRK